MTRGLVTFVHHPLILSFRTKECLPLPTSQFVSYSNKLACCWLYLGSQPPLSRLCFYGFGLWPMDKQPSIHICMCIKYLNAALDIWTAYRTQHIKLNGSHSAMCGPDAHCSTHELRRKKKGFPDSLITFPIKHNFYTYFTRKFTKSCWKLFHHKGDDCILSKMICV